MMETKLGYMTVSLDVTPVGINVACWMSTVDFFMSEKAMFPFQFTYIGEWCTWILHSNTELTAKMIAMVGEQADKMCIETEARNKKRKLANR